MLLAVPLMVLGTFVFLAAGQWRLGRWQDSAQWLATHTSPHVVAGTAPAGVMIFALGLLLVWPPAFLIAFGAAIYWLWRMASSAQDERARLDEAREAAARAKAVESASAPAAQEHPQAAPARRGSDPAREDPGTSRPRRSPGERRAG